jgi:hypothetical protein
MNPLRSLRRGGGLTRIGGLGVCGVLVALSLVGCGTGSGGGGSISITPSVFPCTGESHTVTITLPGSLQATDVITIKEGTVANAGVFDTKSISDWGFVQSGNSWVLSDSGNLTPISFYTYVCAFARPGNYTMYVLDANGKVLAQSNYSQQ